MNLIFNKLKLCYAFIFHRNIRSSNDTNWRLLFDHFRSIIPPSFFTLAFEQTSKLRSVKAFRGKKKGIKIRNDSCLLITKIKMSSKHLSAGDPLPKKVEGILRLYAMEYCPYAHRVKLVLRAKNLDHDIVNVNLIKKPEWIFNIHPEGKVPALDTGSEVIVDSINVANYLDQEYPNPPLYPAEPLAREQNKALIEKIGPLTDIFTKIILGQEKKPAAEWKNELMPHLENFEKELVERGTNFFGGESPGMVDYLLWPWAERAGTIGIILGERLPIETDELPTLRTWRKTLRMHPVVDGIFHGPEKFYKSVQIKKGELPPDYDAI